MPIAPGLAAVAEQGGGGRCSGHHDGDQQGLRRRQIDGRGPCCPLDPSSLDASPPTASPHPPIACLCVVGIWNVGDWYIQG
eukprot:4171544-Alexandrium_andersonii.AAC.1